MISGSIIPRETSETNVESVRVLTVDGIMAKYNLRPRQLVRLRRTLLSMKFSDILFSYPDGPRYDVALNLIATLR